PLHKAKVRLMRDYETVEICPSDTLGNFQFRIYVPDYYYLEVYQDGRYYSSKFYVREDMDTVISVYLHYNFLQFPSTIWEQRTNVRSCYPEKDSSIFLSRSETDFSLEKQAVPINSCRSTPTFNTANGTDINSSLQSGIRALSEYTYSAVTLGAHHASYSYIRNCLQKGILPEPKRVKIEELIQNFQKIGRAHV